MLPQVKNDLLYLLNILESIELKDRNFDEKEFQEARKSFYYRHIPFEKIECENAPPEV